MTASCNIRDVARVQRDRSVATCSTLVKVDGLYGLRFYHQRVAVQGSTDLLDDLQVKAAELH